MTQRQRLLYLIRYLMEEQPEYQGVKIPGGQEGQRRLLRSLMNTRPPRPACDGFFKVQDEYLTEELRRKAVVSMSGLSPAEPGIYLWKGDITTLQADAVVNAANSALLGCFIPCHSCVDNAIHSAAGVQLRLACHKLVEKQGREVVSGAAKITPAFNLPCRYVLHTVGPVIEGTVTEKDCLLLASCYRSCLELAEASGLKSIAFCCISTGEFHFPNEMAAQIAVNTIRSYLRESKSRLEVVFNVYKDLDFAIYRRLLGAG